MNLTGVAQLVWHRLAKRKVTGLTPRQDTCLGGGWGPEPEYLQEATEQCFSLTSMLFSLSFSLPFWEVFFSVCWDLVSRHILCLPQIHFYKIFLHVWTVLHQQTWWNVNSLVRIHCLSSVILYHTIPTTVYNGSLYMKLYLQREYRTEAYLFWCSSSARQCFKANILSVSLWKGSQEVPKTTLCEPLI